MLCVTSRWLRFPCCGQRFACDLCHEEGVPDGHDAAWASRMVCGFCSREQPLDKVCKYCGKKLATSAAQPSGRNTRFWEGGKGCRWVKVWLINSWGCFGRSSRPLVRCAVCGCCCSFVMLISMTVTLPLRDSLRRYGVISRQPAVLWLAQELQAVCDLVLLML